ncbi:MAG: ribosome maturation factor RimP [Clostridiales bacterium]|nr:ribosome maturation factor RimP [Clostridiales bacterium]
MPNKSSSLATLEAACVKLAEETGLEFLDLELVKEPSGRCLRIYMDKEGGINIDDIEAFHKRVRPLTDDIDYDYMEVSSPGADRPLKNPRDFEKALGTEVEVKLFAPVDGIKQLTGILSAYDENSVEIDCAGTVRSFELKKVALIRPFIDVDKELENSPE